MALKLTLLICNFVNLVYTQWNDSNYILAHFTLNRYLFNIVFT